MQPFWELNVVYFLIQKSLAIFFCATIAWKMICFISKYTKKYHMTKLQMEKQRGLNKYFIMYLLYFITIFIPYLLSLNLYKSTKINWLKLLISWDILSLEISFHWYLGLHYEKNNIRFGFSTTSRGKFPFDTKMSSKKKYQIHFQLNIGIPECFK